MTFYQTITAAVADFAANGFDSEDRLEHWLKLIREAAEEAMVDPTLLEKTLKENLYSVYKQFVESGKIIQTTPGISRFTLEQIKPKLRAELDRRIMASAQLIKNNRAEMINKTLQRFSGWATSIPVGGSAVVKKNPVKSTIRKALASLPFEERRVLIDQGHKLVSSISEIVALDTDAIAGIWHSHWRQKNYHYREDHKERDEHVYLIRNNWAMQKGLVKVGPDGYTDQITRPAEEVFCRCFYQWLYHVSELPKTMITEKGLTALSKLKKVA